MIDMIRLDKLELCPANGRTKPPSHEAIGALAESIAAVGLLQNLIGHEDEDGTIRIVGGGRRLRAMKLLAERGDMQPDELVPVQLLNGRAEMAGAVENEARTPLTFVERLRVYERMIAAGHDPAAVAVCFGVSRISVERMVTLASLPDELLTELDEGRMSLQVAKLLAQAGDAAPALWAEHGNSAYGISHAMRIEVNNRNVERSIQILGGVEAAREKGVDVRTDLFGEGLFIDAENIARLHDMAEAETETILDRRSKHLGWLGGGRWRYDDPPKGLRVQTMRIFDGPEDWLALADAIDEGDVDDGMTTAMRDALADEKGDEDWRAPTLKDDEEVIEAFLGMVSDRTTNGWPDALKPWAMIYWWRLEDNQHCAVVIPEDKIEAAVAAGVASLQPKDDAARSGGTDKAPSPQGETASPEGESSTPLDKMSFALTEDLSRLPVALSRPLLTKTPDLALKLLAWRFLAPVINAPIRTRQPVSAAPGDRLACEMHDPVAEIPSLKKLDLSDIETFCLTSDAKVVKAILAHFVAEWLTKEGADTVLAMKSKSIRELWTPDEAFLARLNKKQLEQVAREIKASTWTGKPRKEEMVAELAAAFAKGDGADWLPPSIL